MRPSIFLVDERMKPIASGRSSVAAMRACCATGSVRSEPAFGFFDQRLQAVHAAFELAGEAHDVDQRRPQVMRDDIGEALDLLVGPREISGPLLHPLFEARVEDAHLVARPRESRAYSERP